MACQLVRSQIETLTGVLTEVRPRTILMPNLRYFVSYCMTLTVHTVLTGLSLAQLGPDEMQVTASPQTMIIVPSSYILPQVLGSIAHQLIN